MSTPRDEADPRPAGTEQDRRCAPFRARPGLETASASPPRWRCRGPQYGVVSVEHYRDDGGYGERFAPRMPSISLHAVVEHVQRQGFRNEDLEVLMRSPRSPPSRCAFDETIPGE